MQSENYFIPDARTVIDYSVTESEVLGLKTGRCNSEYFDSTKLYSQIVEGRYDVCRLKAPAEDEMAAYRLNKTGLPFFFSGSIRRYKTRITENSPGLYNHTDLVFELYDGSQDKLLKEMIRGTWGAYPIGYYRTPYIGALVDKETEIECLFQFYKKANLNERNPDNSILFIRHGDNYVGFFALNKLNRNLESHIGGILQPFRKGGYFLDKLHYIKEFCVRNKLEHFIFGARNENSEVQRIFQYVGFQATGSENVFHIPCLLSYSKLPTVERDVKVVSKNLREWHQQLFADATSVANSIQPDLNNISFQLNEFYFLQNETSLKVSYSFPVVTDEDILIVIRALADNCNLTGYLRLGNQNF